MKQYNYTDYTVIEGSNLHIVGTSYDTYSYNTNFFGEEMIVVVDGAHVYSIAIGTNQDCGYDHIFFDTVLPPGKHKVSTFSYTRRTPDATIYVTVTGVTKPSAFPWLPAVLELLD